MKTSDLTLPEVGLIAATRAMAGAGVALLVADKLNEAQRKVIGWTLFLMGAVSTIPLVIDVFSKRHDVTNKKRPLLTAMRGHKNKMLF